jgi:hypothetical protein
MAHLQRFTVHGEKWVYLQGLERPPPPLGWFKSITVARPALLRYRVHGIGLPVAILGTMPPSSAGRFPIPRRFAISARYPTGGPSPRGYIRTCPGRFPRPGLFVSYGSTNRGSVTVDRAAFAGQFAVQKQRQFPARGEGREYFLPASPRLAVAKPTAPVKMLEPISVPMGLVAIEDRRT